jgi:hypothetical protein
VGTSKECQGVPGTSGDGHLRRWLGLLESRLHQVESVCRWRVAVVALVGQSPARRVVVVALVVQSSGACGASDARGTSGDGPSGRGELVELPEMGRRGVETGAGTFGDWSALMMAWLWDSGVVLVGAGTSGDREGRAWRASRRRCAESDGVGVSSPALASSGGERRGVAGQAPPAVEAVRSSRLVERIVVVAVGWCVLWDSRHLRRWCGVLRAAPPEMGRRGLETVVVVPLGVGRRERQGLVKRCSVEVLLRLASRGGAWRVAPPEMVQRPEGGVVQGLATNVRSALAASALRPSNAAPDR